MSKRLCLAVAMCLALGGVSGQSPAAGDAEKLVLDAELVIRDVLRHEKYDGLRGLLKKAHGVLIIPAYVKAGLVWGGAGGTGVLLSRDVQTNQWSAPAFFGLGAASVGLQIGVSSSEVVMVIMNDRGLRALIETEIKLGADLSVAAGPIGGRGETATTGNLVADIYSYARSRGLFAGVSLEGGLVKPRRTYNREFYGSDIDVQAVLVARSTGGDKAQTLRDLLRDISAR